MPLYVFSCESCGLIFEELLPMSESGIESFGCPCGSKAERILALVTMRPDSYWSGVVTADGKYWTSRSKFDADQRRRGIERITSRRDLEAMHKLADEGRKSKKEKASKIRRKIVEEALMGVDDNQLKESAFDTNGRFKGSPAETINIYSSGRSEDRVKETVSKGK
jgi:putative FmdB family regulatory protein